jgi:aspartyl-tRNA(Asn)/glutamyl-tRNA(Gln) amidotransferase subunit C
MGAGDDRFDVDKTAELARIDLDEDARRRLRSDMAKIVAYVDKLAELDVDGVEPTSHAIPLSDVTRDDVAEPSLERDAALSNAPATVDGELVKVPPVIEQ